MKKLVKLSALVMLISAFTSFSYAINDDENLDGEWDYDFDEEFLDDEDDPQEFYEWDYGKGIDSNTETRTGSLTTREKAFQEVAYAYYMRGPYLQYNLAKGIGNILSPEESTSQDYHFMACTLYIMNVYKELLGINLSANGYHYYQYAKKYLGKRPEVIGYAEKSGKNLYWYYGTGILIPKDCKDTDGNPVHTNPTQSCIIKQLKIGDIIQYGGHSMLVYDYIYSGDDIVDVYLLNSLESNYYKSNMKAGHNESVKYYDKNGSGVLLRAGLSPWGNLYFTYRSGGIHADSGFIEIEGTIRLEKFTSYRSGFIFPGQISSDYKDYYAILRFVTTDNTGNSVLSFVGGYGTFRTPTQTSTLNNKIIDYSDSVKSRLNYSKLYIEKTVDKKDNDIVEPSDELTYEILIKNESNKDYESGLIVTEYIDTNLIEYLGYSYTKSGTSTDDIKQLESNNENQLKWNIGKLNSKDEVVIQYTVKVKTGYIGETIESIGLVDNIPSGIVKNKIGKNTNKGEELKESFNNLSGSGYTGKVLINKIYEETYGINLGLDNIKILTNTSGDENGLIYFNKKWGAWYYASGNAEIYINKKNTFSGMVLNSYFNALYETVKGQSRDNVNIITYAIPAFWTEEKNPDSRANIVYPTDFKTGDVLIYTNENDVKYSLSTTTGLVNTGLDDDGIMTGTIVKGTKVTPMTYENGEYAYIYIDGKFVGVNLGKDGVEDVGETGDDRNEFTKKYYDDNNLSLYTESNILLADTDELKEFLQYQTLFGKDAYVILRPSLMIRNVTYKLDGGENIQDNPIAFILGDEIELKDPVKDGFTFQGWYTNPGLTEAFDSSDSFAEDITLYAKWESNNTNNEAEQLPITNSGGGRSRKRDKCPNGDNSGSYYDGKCEKDTQNTHNAPNTHNAANTVESPYQRGEELKYDVSKYNSNYSDELNQAYQYAYYYGMTTKESIEDANMTGSLTRLAMAKMLSQYAINILGKESENTTQKKFNDVSEKLNLDSSNSIALAYQLGIMGINMPHNNFRPYDTVTRAEFATALSRLLYKLPDGKDKYYSTHLTRLNLEGIISNTNPSMKEKRGYAILMLMRSED